MLFSRTLPGIDEEFIQVLQLSQIITPSLYKPVFTSFHFTGTLIFALSCLKFAVINHQPTFTQFHIILSQK
ncbi:MAG: hypothetical protein P1U46_00300 [Patescibacteria group bacterium]|nr:hypothetical protein [Patescibacteria group bacterium]